MDVYHVRIINLEFVLVALIVWLTLKMVFVPAHLDTEWMMMEFVLYVKFMVVKNVMKINVFLVEKTSK